MHKPKSGRCFPTAAQHSTRSLLHSPQLKGWECPKHTTVKGAIMVTCANRKMWAIATKCFGASIAQWQRARLVNLRSWAQSPTGGSSKTRYKQNCGSMDFAFVHVILLVALPTRAPSHRPVDEIKWNHPWARSRAAGLKHSAARQVWLGR